MRQRIKGRKKGNRSDNSSRSNQYEYNINNEESQINEPCKQEIIPLKDLIDSKLKLFRKSEFSNDLVVSDIYDSSKRTERRHPKYTTNPKTDHSFVKNSKYSTADIISLTQSNRQSKALVISGISKHKDISIEESKISKMSPTAPIHTPELKNDENETTHKKDKLGDQRHNSTKESLYLDNLMIGDKMNAEKQTTRKKVSPYNNIPLFFKQRNKWNKNQSSSKFLKARNNMSKSMNRIGYKALVGWLS